jgi:hypothetical protein
MRSHKNRNERAVFVDLRWVVAQRAVFERALLRGYSSAVKGKALGEAGEEGQSSHDGPGVDFGLASCTRHSLTVTM